MSVTTSSNPYLPAETLTEISYISPFGTVRFVDGTNGNNGNDGQIYNGCPKRYCFIYITFICRCWN